jgi:hypothetical protein
MMEALRRVAEIDQNAKQDPIAMRSYMMRSLSGWLLGVVIAMAASWSVAEDDVQTFLDPEKAGIIYQLQGEYLGNLDNDGIAERWGAQVIALGDQKFAVTGYKGGLPGDGWSRGDQEEKLEGELTASGAVICRDDDVELVIRDGTMAVKADGRMLGQLKRIERTSPTLGQKPPDGAVVLFDGTSADAFERGKIVEGNLLASDCESKRKFGDHSLHIEFRTPFKPAARGQARGNSGVYIQSRYELQVLDSFGLEGANNECGGIYSIAQPKVNMCFPPLTWQTYDIDFTAARYNDQGEKTKNARVTIRHNGVVIHENLELPKGTPGKNAEGPGPDGLYLQGHGNPVMYRNIWVMEK